MILKCLWEFFFLNDPFSTMMIKRWGVTRRGNRCRAQQGDRRGKELKLTLWFWLWSLWPLGDESEVEIERAVQRENWWRDHVDVLARLMRSIHFAVERVRNRGIQFYGHLGLFFFVSFEIIACASERAKDRCRLHERKCSHSVLTSIVHCSH